MAAAAVASPGSVISSFYLSGNIYPIAVSVYRNYNTPYVYGLFDTNGGAELRTYTTAGSLTGSLTLPGMTGRPIDADHCTLGSSYFCVLDNGSLLRTYTLANGLLIGSMAVPPSTGYGCLYYYDKYTCFARGNYVFVYNSGGSLISSFSGGVNVGTLAFSESYNTLHPHCIIVIPSAQGLQPCRVFNTGGSLLGTFTFSGPYPGMDIRGGASAGDSLAYVETLWVMLQTDAINRAAYEVDLGNILMDVVPSSLGTIKALYR